MRQDEIRKLLRDASGYNDNGPGGTVRPCLVVAPVYHAPVYYGPVTINMAHGGRDAASGPDQ